MTDNSKNMTLEERLVQHIKGTALMTLVGDEDALTELTKRAVHEALFASRRVQSSNGYSTYDDKSPAVKMAEEVVAKAYERIVEAEVVAMMADPKVRETLQRAIVMMVPNIMEKILLRTYSQMAEESARRSIDLLKEWGHIK